MHDVDLLDAWLETVKVPEYEEVMGRLDSQQRYVVEASAGLLHDGTRYTVPQITAQLNLRSHDRIQKMFVAGLRKIKRYSETMQLLLMKFGESNYGS